MKTTASYWLRAASWTGLAAATTLAYAHWIETRWLRIVRLDVAVRDLPPAFNHYRIAHLSDLHLGVTQIERQLPNIVQAVNRERPHLVALTGDVTTSLRDGLRGAQAALADLRAPDGVWASMGNHDYYVGAEAMEAALREVNITLLRNQHHVVRHGGDTLVIAGLDDALRSYPNLQTTLEGVEGIHRVILMAHEPDIARMVATDKRVFLQLSGHTHGGQIRLPLPGVRMLPGLGHVYPKGTHILGSMLLHVTTGLGTGRFALRFNCRPEFALITLWRDRLPRPEEKSC